MKSVIMRSANKLWQMVAHILHVGESTIVSCKIDKDYNSRSVGHMIDILTRKLESKVITIICFVSELI